MKYLIKLFSILTALIFTICILPAQTNSIGGRIGINSATVDIKDPSGLSVEPNSRVGLDIAVIYNIGITEAFSIQPELHFIQKGFKLDLEFEFFGSTTRVETNTSLNYMEIPVLAKYAFGSEKVQGFVQGGPSFGFGLSGKTKSTSEGETETENINFGSGEDEIKPLDAGIVIGGGIGIPAGSGQVFLDIRYLLGLTNISNQPSSEGTIKNRGINIALGVLFPIGK